MKSEDKDNIVINLQTGIWLIREHSVIDSYQKLAEIERAIEIAFESPIDTWLIDTRICERISGCSVNGNGNQSRFCFRNFSIVCEMSSSLKLN